MRVTKIGPPTPKYNKALGYSPETPIGPVEPPEFEGATVLTPQDYGSGIVFENAPTVTDGDVDTYNLTTEHTEAMRIILDFPVRFSGVEVIGAWEVAGEKTYTLEGANLPDYSDAIELAEETFDVFDDWEPVTITFDYPSPTVGHQYYRLIGPDEERRWHNLRLLEDIRAGCECLELCRDAPPLALKAAATSPTSADANPINVGEIPEAGDLWLIWKPGTETPSGFTQIGPVLQPNGSALEWALWSRECDGSESGQITLGSSTQWITALFEGAAGTHDEVAFQDEQTSGAGTLEVPITVPADPHLVVAFFAHENTTVAGTAPESGWTQIDEEHYAGSKVYVGIYDSVAGGGAETPGVVMGFAGDWVGIAASFTTGLLAIEGGPNATAGDGAKAAPCTHDHHYTAEQVSFTPAGSIAATNVQDAIEEAVAEASGGTPATTVESETTFGITPAVGTDTEYARQDHTHGSPPDPIADASSVWMPLTTVDGGDPVLVWDGDDSLIPTLVPLE